jgi:hypothetical protein
VLNTIHFYQTIPDKNNFTFEKLAHFLFYLQFSWFP